MTTANSLNAAPPKTGREPFQTPAQVALAVADLTERMARECGADVPPIMSASLRRVLDVVEEIEANGIEITSLDMPFADEITISIDAGADLDGDSEMEMDVFGKKAISRCMDYRGCLIEWTFSAEELAHGA